MDTDRLEEAALLIAALAAGGDPPADRALLELARALPVRLSGLLDVEVDTVPLLLLSSSSLPADLLVPVAAGVRDLGEAQRLLLAHPASSPEVRSRWVFHLWDAFGSHPLVERLLGLLPGPDGPLLRLAWSRLRVVSYALWAELLPELSRLDAAQAEVFARLAGDDPTRTLSRDRVRALLAASVRV